MRGRFGTAVALVAGVGAIAGLIVVGLDQAPRFMRGSDSASDAPIPGIAVLMADPLPWNGVVWNEIVDPPGVAMDARTEIRGVISDAGRLVAFGRGPNPNRNPNGLTETSWIWTSGDAHIWNGVPVTAGFGEASVSEVNMVAASAAGVVAAGGVCCVEEGPAIWWSGDGRNWVRSDFRAGAVLDLVAGQDGFVAVGSVGDRGAIWSSGDGLTWRQEEAGRAGLVRGTVADAATVPGGYIAVGSDDPGANADGAVWTAATLDAWTRAAGDPAFTTPDEESLSRVVPFAGGTFAVGGRGTPAERKECEDLLEGSGALVAGGFETALNCGWLREMNWRTEPGQAWEWVDPWGPDGLYPPERGGPANAAIISWSFVRAGGPGLVLLDYEWLGGDETGSIIGLWTSADGRSWSRVGVEPHLGPGDTLTGVAVIGRTVVAVGGVWDGSHPEDPAVWIGRVTP